MCTLKYASTNVPWTWTPAPWAKCISWRTSEAGGGSAARLRPRRSSINQTPLSKTKVSFPAIFSFVTNGRFLSFGRTHGVLVLLHRLRRCPCSSRCTLRMAPCIPWPCSATGFLRGKTDRSAKWKWPTERAYERHRGLESPSPLWKYSAHHSFVRGGLEYQSRAPRPCYIISQSASVPLFATFPLLGQIGGGLPRVSQGLRGWHPSYSGVRDIVPWDRMGSVVTYVCNDSEGRLRYWGYNQWVAISEMFAHLGMSHPRASPGTRPEQRPQFASFATFSSTGPCQSDSL